MEYYGTLGPGCKEPETLKRMLRAGMTGLRLNLSHGALPRQASFLAAWQQAKEETGSNAGLMLDLEGPELRIGTLPEPLLLSPGETLLFGDGGIPIPPALLPWLTPGQEVRLDDGKLLLQVEAGGNTAATCRVIRGGRLSSRKSLALPGSPVRLPVLTEADRENLRLASQAGVTGVMLPFVHAPEDIRELKQALEEAGVPQLRIFAKLEDAEGLRRLPELAPLSHTIVIARGDLGNALKPWELPRAQKEAARICRLWNTPFLVVTQLLDSMEQRPVPTHAEVLDIFNAVLDGASALMLTGETAAGRYPVQAMDILVKTGEEALRYRAECCCPFTGR